MALDMQKITSELRHLAEAGVPTPNLMISDRAQLLLPYHILQDTYEEERLGGHAFGSTKSGIAPFYSDKYAKIGIQVCDLFDPPRLREHVERAVEVKNILFQTLYHKPPINAEALFRELRELREIISPYVGDTVTYLHQALQNGKSILLEGQLGAMKDPGLGHGSHDHVFPYVSRVWLCGRPGSTHRDSRCHLCHQGLLLLCRCANRAFRE